MIYTPKERKHLDAILTAFHDYIEQNSKFDILYSSKCGYLYLSLEDELIPMERRLTVCDLLNILFHEISCDVRDLFLCGEHLDVFLYPKEVDEVRNRIKPYLLLLPAEYQTHGKASMEFFLKHCNEILELSDTCVR